MPWKKTCVMDLKIQMISDWLTKNYSPTELSRNYHISRKTVYKWISRYNKDPDNGLKNLSKAPHNFAHAVPDSVREIIIKAKLTYPHFGPKKVIDYLRRQYPDQYWPADSTTGLILKKAGLVRTKKHRAHVAPNILPFSDCNAPNSVWSADYKGDFKIGKGIRCYPLTVSDNYSRYLLACQALSNTQYIHARSVFEQLFYQYGLPQAIRTDNGSPFASTAFGGISRLSAWWIRLGILPERIEKAKPNQNGRHERMHRSLKEGAINPARYSIKAQQKAFDQYRFEYNDIRSHESLARKVPSDFYQHSSRRLSSKQPEIEYDSRYKVRRIRYAGDIKWQGQLIYISRVLSKERIGLRQISEDLWSIHYSFYTLGYWNQRKQKLEPLRKRCNPSLAPSAAPIGSKRLRDEN